jgi:hypothetical protein
VEFRGRHNANSCPEHEAFRPVARVLPSIQAPLRSTSVVPRICTCKDDARRSNAATNGRENPDTARAVVHIRSARRRRSSHMGPKPSHGSPFERLQSLLTIADLAASPKLHGQSRVVHSFYVWGPRGLRERGQSPKVGCNFLLNYEIPRRVEVVLKLSPASDLHATHALFQNCCRLLNRSKAERLHPNPSLDQRPCYFLAMAPKSLAEMHAKAIRPSRLILAARVA